MYSFLDSILLGLGEVLVFIVILGVLTLYHFQVRIFNATPLYWSSHQVGVPVRLAGDTKPPLTFLSFFRTGTCRM